MFSTENTDTDIERVITAFKALERRSATDTAPPSISQPERAISMREALMSSSERVPVELSLGRICASPSVSCPPAIPPIVSGERIDSDSINLLLYYGITEIDVVK
jgi:arginine/lysine/ornithine decarboxylase